jgi:hypothetical protein
VVNGIRSRMTLGRWTSTIPDKQSSRELMITAKKDIQEEKVIQKIKWMKWDARKPDLQLIRQARKEEEQRKKIIGEELPEYFRQEPEPLQEVVVTPVIQDSKKEEQETHVIPFKRKIGFYQEDRNRIHSICFSQTQKHVPKQSRLQKN